MKFLVATSSTVITKGYIERLLSFQIFLISRAKFSFFVISSASVLGRLWANGTAISVMSAVLFCLSMSTMSGLLKSVVLWVMIDLSQYKITLDDSRTLSGFYLQHGAVAYTIWQSVGELFLIVSFVFRDMQFRIVISTQLLCISLFRPLYHMVCFYRSLPLLSSASHNFWYWSPGVGWRLPNLPSQDGYSWRKATMRRNLCPSDFLVQGLGIFRIGFLFTKCSNLLVSLLRVHRLPRFDYLVIGSVSFICLHSQTHQAFFK